MEQKNMAASPCRAWHTGKDVQVPGLFPASSPPKQQKEVMVPNLVADLPASIPADKGTGDKLSENISFDDGISVLSQHTLEELAKVYEGHNGFLERVHSDITQDPIEETDESWKHTFDPNRGVDQAIGMSPLRLTRQGRSHGTMNTKQSRGARSMATKSTMSTQTNDFASAWRKDEQMYWEDVVKEDTDPAESVGLSSRHEKLIRARKLVRRYARTGREMVR
jgi:hypothetical protein